MAVGFPKQKTYRGGFYDNKVANGNDRVYTAKDMRKPYDALFTDGIKPAADGTAGENLKVNLVGGMVISVNAGYAKLGGAWFENTATYNITLESHRSTVRYDCVILRNNDSDEVRAPEIDIRSLNHVPTSADLTRPVDGVGDIYEVCLAYVRVPALEGDITIVDTREDGQLCNVMSGVGAMVVRTYRNVEPILTTIKDQTRINIEIPQFNRFRDHLTVIVEGRILSSSAYNIPSNTYIELVTGLPVIGTKVDFEVRKNVNAAGADTVVQEVGGLLNDMANVNATLVHHYNCNGSTDNVNISRIVTDFHSESTEDYSSMRLVIHGTFGATSPLGGEGTADNAYYWIRAAQGAAAKRRVILDFTDCKQISINCAAGTTNIIFFGMDCQVIGANVIATGGTTIYMFSTAGGTSVYAENCRFWITCDSGGFIARSGTFKNCRATVRNSGLHSYCFAPIYASLLRVEGGEYYAYTKSKEHVSAIVGLTSGENAVAILYAVNAPTADQSASGYSQTNSIYQTTGMVSCTDLISTLPLDVVTGQSNIRGTLVFSKPGLM